MDLRLCRCTVAGCNTLSDTNPLTGSKVKGQYISKREYRKHYEAQTEMDPTALACKLASVTLSRTFDAQGLFHEIEG
jgi:hypothetical protein